MGQVVEIYHKLYIVSEVFWVFEKESTHYTLLDLLAGRGRGKHHKKVTTVICAGKSTQIAQENLT